MTQRVGEAIHIGITSLAAALTVSLGVVLVGDLGKLLGGGFLALPNGNPDGVHATPDVSPAPVKSSATSLEIASLLRRVRVVPKAPSVDGYDRDCGPGDDCVFGPEWSDDTKAPDGHNGCDTRNDVLAAQMTEVAWDPGSGNCDVVGGVLQDPYTGVRMDYASEGSLIHIDHVFPLAAAWDLGASAWRAHKRARFANDTQVELLAVSGQANLSKGDSTPASWLPPNEVFRCEYVAIYLRVAVRYGLSVTAADITVISHVAKRC